MQEKASSIVVKEEDTKEEPVSESGDGAVGGDPPPGAEGGEGPLPSGGQGVEVGGTYMVRRADNTWCQAEVIQKRVNEVENQYEYYVHYENFNRRLDEWVLRDRIMASYDGMEAENGHDLGDSDRKITRNQKRKHDEINHVQKTYAEMDPTQQLWRRNMKLSPK
eukprot:TRINITY_DN2658_c0_g1_i1.p1 TRINITY_DN2658_c0_g1~~TRINITY_DN2658_c0_g1_i1.p1  ORF type:complete len:164 (-),score=68.37 TRINITY_DN2658_c0_g1_i1:230-721(-)